MEIQFKTQTQECTGAAAQTLNTINTYRLYTLADGIPLPRTKLNWLNMYANNEGGAAPMLQGNVFNSWPAFLVAVLFPIPYYPLSLYLLPDVVNKYTTSSTAKKFNSVSFHELGHTSHYKLVGETYWFGYRNHIINNNGYGEFGAFNYGSNPGKVALGEAIGNYIGASYGNSYYGSEPIAFDSYSAPNPNNFIPRGLMWDLEDGINTSDKITDPNNFSEGSDNISGFTKQMIFNSLTPGVSVTDIRAFRDKLRTLHLSDTSNNATDFNAFLDLYDVFN